MINNIKLTTGAINGAQNPCPNSRYTAAKNVLSAQNNLNFTPTPPCPAVYIIQREFHSEGMFKYTKTAEKMNFTTDTKILLLQISL